MAAMPAPSRALTTGIREQILQGASRYHLIRMRLGVRRSSKGEAAV
jgi:hypothetical protein